MAEAVTVATRSEDETRALGAALGESVEPGDIILLHGAFGAGKTTFVQGLARGLGVADQVTSPSFVIACEYQGRVPLYHIDLYRIGQMDETTLEALAEYFGGDGVCAVEWPDAVPAELVREAIRISLTATGDEERTLTIEGAPARLREVFERRLAQPARGGNDGRRRSAPRH